MILKALAAIAIGAILGSGVGYLLRCSGGSCPLTCNPWGGAIFGALIGLSYIMH